MRDLLADDSATPAGIDLAAVRRRAAGIRRVRRIAAGSAVLVALAVAGPALALRPGPAPTADPPPPPFACPDRLPDPDALGNTGPGLDLLLAPIAPDAGLVCEYGPRDRQRPLYRDDAARVVAALNSLVAPGRCGPARSPDGGPFLYVLRGEGRVVVVRVDRAQCGPTTNGTLSVAAGTEP